MQSYLQVDRSCTLGFHLLDLQVFSPDRRKLGLRLTLEKEVAVTVELCFSPNRLSRDPVLHGECQISFATGLELRLFSMPDILPPCQNPHSARFVLCSH